MSVCVYIYKFMCVCVEPHDDSDDSEYVDIPEAKELMCGQQVCVCVCVYGRHKHVLT